MAEYVANKGDSDDHDDGAKDGDDKKKKKRAARGSSKKSKKAKESKTQATLDFKVRHNNQQAWEQEREAGGERRKEDGTRLPNDIGSQALHTQLICPCPPAPCVPISRLHPFRAPRPLNPLIRSDPIVLPPHPAQFPPFALFCHERAPHASTVYRCCYCCLWHACMCAI